MQVKVSVRKCHMMVADVGTIQLHLNLCFYGELEFAVQTSYLIRRCKAGSVEVGGSETEVTDICPLTVLLSSFP